jgi:enoyl-CoA hydratase
MSLAVENHDNIAVITLDAPQRRNAISVDMAERFHRALDIVESDDVRAVVVTGKGPAFCAGADLAETSTVDGAPEMIYEIFSRLAALPLPSIAALNGPAIGAGVNLALACDVRLFSRSAYLDSRFLKVGLHPGGGHNWLMIRASGLQATFATVLFGEIVDAEQAVEIGLAWRCVDDDALAETALTMARSASRISRELLVRTKNTIMGAGDLRSHSEAIAIEAVQQEWSVRQPEFERRLPNFKTRVAE